MVRGNEAAWKEVLTASNEEAKMYGSLQRREKTLRVYISEQK